MSDPQPRLPLRSKLELLSRVLFGLPGPLVGLGLLVASMGGLLGLRAGPWLPGDQAALTRTHAALEACEASLQQFDEIVEEGGPGIFLLPAAASNAVKALQVANTELESIEDRWNRGVRDAQEVMGDLVGEVRLRSRILDRALSPERRG